MSQTETVCTHRRGLPGCGTRKDGHTRVEVSVAPGFPAAGGVHEAWMSTHRHVGERELVKVAEGVVAAAHQVVHLVARVVGGQDHHERPGRHVDKQLHALHV